MCRVLGVSRSGYYDWRKRVPSKRSVENAALTERIGEIHEASHQVYGSPRIHAKLQEEGVEISRPRVARLMRKAHIRSKMTRKFVHTTNSKHNFRIAPNLLDREFAPGKINQAWVSDITYIHTQEGWLYLTVIIDLGDRKVIGWSLSNSIDTNSTVIQAWNMAIGRRIPAKGLIFHSDRGVQYACDAFRETLVKAKGVKQSMSKKGDCWDNAVAESFFKSIKNESLKHETFRTRKQAEARVFDYIEIWYNNQRLHSALGYKTPNQFNKQLQKKSIAA